MTSIAPTRNPPKETPTTTGTMRIRAGVATEIEDRMGIIATLRKKNSSRETVTPK